MSFAVLLQSPLHVFCCSSTLPTSCVLLFSYTPRPLLIQIDKANNRVRVLKRQLEEAEEETAKVTSQKRKIQRELDDQMEAAETTQRDLDSLKTKFRMGGASDKIRYLLCTTHCCCHFVQYSSKFYSVEDSIVVTSGFPSNVNWPVVLSKCISRM